jgi:hypothetical protein
MAAHFLIVAAMLCPIYVPIIDKIADGLPKGPSQILLIPVSVIDIGCAIISHTPFSIAMASEIASHTLGGLKAAITFHNQYHFKYCINIIPGRRGSVLSECVNGGALENYHYNNLPIKQGKVHVRQ